MHLYAFLLGAAAIARVLAVPAPNAEPKAPISKRKNFWFAGVNESGAEFGSGNLPGKLGTDYTWPLTSSVDVSPSVPKKR